MRTATSAKDSSRSSASGIGSDWFQWLPAGEMLMEATALEVDGDRAPMLIDVDPEIDTPAGIVGIVATVATDERDVGGGGAPDHVVAVLWASRRQPMAPGDRSDRLDHQVSDGSIRTSDGVGRGRHAIERCAAADTGPSGVARRTRR